MSKKKKLQKSGPEKILSYTTDPSGYNPFKDLAVGPQKSTNSKDEPIRVKYEKKGRGGKTVSIISGIKSHPDGLAELATLIKNKCGTGGSAKDGDIIIQGDHRDKIMDILKSKGYSNVKKSGG
ncbi:MAG: translation initiation factor [Saprospirales bacterium]|nr:MAG: translation initiation factor [Saprospirales bacterium]